MKSHNFDASTLKKLCDHSSSDSPSKNPTHTPTPSIAAFTGALGFLPAPLQLQTSTTHPDLFTGTYIAIAGSVLTPHTRQ